MPGSVWILGFLGGGIFFVAAALTLARLLRPSLPNHIKNQVYECGEPATHDYPVRYNIRYYLAALLFVIFDVEVIFILPWAISLESAGKEGFILIMAFVLILFAGLAYAWKKGALEWH